MMRVRTGIPDDMDPVLKEMRKWCLLAGVLEEIEEDVMGRSLQAGFDLTQLVADLRLATLRRLLAYVMRPPTTHPRLHYILIFFSRYLSTNIRPCSHSTPTS